MLPLGAGLKNAGAGSVLVFSVLRSQENANEDYPQCILINPNVVCGGRREKPLNWLAGRRVPDSQ
jgi:hypothetical protein